MLKLFMSHNKFQSTFEVPPVPTQSDAPLTEGHVSQRQIPIKQTKTNTQKLWVVLMPHSGLEHFRSKFTQELGTVRLWKVQENLIDTFALGVADCA